MSYSQLLGVYGGVILLAIFLLILAEKFSAWSEAEVSIESDDLDPVEAEPKLNAWDRFCLRCDRAYGRMRQLVPVFLMTLAAIMAVPAAVGCAGLLKGFSWEAAIDPETSLELFPPTFTAEARTAIVALIGFIVLSLAVLLVINIFSRMESKRLEAFRRWELQQEAQPSGG